jgi:DNA-binding response OmpR family regulator
MDCRSRRDHSTPECSYATFSPAPKGFLKTVLILDDDSGSLNVLYWVLERNYRLLKAQNSEEAILLCQEHKETISLIVADLVLNSPISGTEVGLRVRESCPDVPILFTSGRPLEAWRDGDFVNLKTLMSGRVGFLPKPFTAQALRSRVADLFNGASSSDIETMFHEAEKYRQARNDVPAFLMAPFFVLYLDRLQVEPEERVLSVRFGQEFIDYRARVRRWL